jgi:hypothetical protein
MCFPPPIFGPHLSVYTVATGIHLFHRRVREMVIEWEMSSDISYHCNRVSIPERCSYSFNINRILRPSSYKSIYSSHVRNERFELVSVFGIGVGYNNSLFEVVVEFPFT